MGKYSILRSTANICIKPYYWFSSQHCIACASIVSNVNVFQCLLFFLQTCAAIGGRGDFSQSLCGVQRHSRRLLPNLTRSSGKTPRLKSGWSIWVLTVMSGKKCIFKFITKPNRVLSHRMHSASFGLSS